MKRIIATILALTLLSALALIGASAADFVPSADAWEAKVNSATLDGKDVSNLITVTPYANRDNLTKEEKAEIEKAYKDITDGVPGLSGDYKVAALFDVSFNGEVTGPVTLKLELNYGSGVKEILVKNLKTNKWEKVDFTLDGNVATITFEHFCPVAILVGSPIVSDVSKDSPQTGDSNSALVALGALVVCTAAAATVVLKKRSF